MEEIFKIILVCLLFAAVFEIVSPHDDTKSVKKNTTHTECYYDADGNEFCVDKYVREEPDIDPYYGWSYD